MVNSLPVGTIIRGRFLIQDQLSDSGFGNIYLVRDQRNRGNNANLFVLKEVINPSRHKLYQITLDGMALRLLRHEALPRVYNVLSDAKYDRVYVLMDYIEGLSLGMVRLHQPGKCFSFPQAIIIMEPVLSAVAYLHSQQPPVLHQDIKPASIIVLSTRDKVVLVDFGVGKKYNLGSTTTSARHSLTPYEAPEQYDGEIDTRSDIYGLGATFYTLLTGTVPDDALYRASKSVDSLEPMYQVVPAISMHVADTIHRAMSLSGNDRFASVHSQRGNRARVFPQSHEVRASGYDGRSGESEVAEHVGRAFEESVRLCGGTLQAMRDRLVDGHCCGSERRDAQCDYGVVGAKKRNVFTLVLGEKKLRLEENCQDGNRAAKLQLEENW